MNESLLFEVKQNYSEFTNSTINDEKTNLNIIKTIVITIILGSLTIFTAIGNIFVIVTIFLDRNLRTLQNYLILSLSVADLMVACLVMPLGAIYVVYDEWILGTLLCYFWTSADLLCCTASILNLLAIAIDRYRSVTNVNYVHKRSTATVTLTILLVWLVASLVSVCPLLGLKDPNFEHRIKVEKRCLISQDIRFQIFATFAAFYGPLLLILLLYWKIYKVARKRIRNKSGSQYNYQFESRREILPEIKNPNRLQEASNLDTSAEAQHSSIESHTIEIKVNSSNRHKKSKAEKINSLNIASNEFREYSLSKRERKTAKILMMITGAFIGCWLPFFICALITPLCPNCIPFEVSNLFLWLGFVNSLLNPVIYTVFSPEFRTSFQKMFRRNRPNV